MPPGKTIFSQLNDADPAVRVAAQRRIAAEVAARGGDVKAAAEALGISIRTARRWMDAFGDLGEPAAGAASSEPPVAARPRPADAGRPPVVVTPSAGAPTGSEDAATPERAAERPTPSPFRDFRPLHGRPLGGQTAAQSATSPAATGAPVGPDAPPAPPRSAADVASFPPPGGGAAAAPAAPGAPVPSPRPPLVARPGGEWPHHQPDAAVPALAGEGDGGPRRLAFVLHAHLPWVLGHGTWPHGEDWLAEAVAHCYLPLVSALERLAARGGRSVLTLSLSPVLAAQLADPRAAPLVAGYLAHRLAAARGLAAEHPLGPWWAATYERLAGEWERLGGDLLGAAARLQRDGVIELATCAVTHGYLPLLHRPEHVTLQVAAAVANHERWFGAAPAGMWMPECAYRPGGPWEQPATGAREPQRPGNERFLAAAGIRWTVVDAHLVLGGEPLLPYHLTIGPEAPPAGAVDEGGPAVTVPPLGRRLQPRRIGDSGVVALPREPHSAHQVWSRHGGYPGDPRYLDFHKRHADSGLRLWRVTDVAGDLADKLPYHADEAAAAVRDQAAHFVDLVAAVPGLAGGVAVCPYDAELFGHWWFEGVDWLEAVLTRCLHDPRVEPTTPARELAEHPPAAAVRLLEGSWGEGGDHRVWLNDATGWMWEALREAEEAVAAALPAAGSRRGRALLAQLLLLAASDWPFLVTTGTAADYATDRFRTHRNRLQQLLDAGDSPLPRWVDEDLAGLQLDPAWWRRGEG